MRRRKAFPEAEKAANPPIDTTIKRQKHQSITMKILEGKLAADGQRIGIVASRFNDFIVSHLITGAEDCFVRHGGDTENLTLAYVPGAFEIPVTAQKMAESGNYDAVVCLGAVIRGATPHFDMVANESAKGIAQAAMKSGVPVLNGILTTDSIEQAIERAGTKAGNKGADAMISAIEMINLNKAL